MMDRNSRNKPLEEATHVAEQFKLADGDPRLLIRDC